MLSLLLLQAVCEGRFGNAVAIARLVGGVRWGIMTPPGPGAVGRTGGHPGRDHVHEWDVPAASLHRRRRGCPQPLLARRGADIMAALQRPSERGGTGTPRANAPPSRENLGREAGIYLRAPPTPHRLVALHCYPSCACPHVRQHLSCRHGRATEPWTAGLLLSKRALGRARKRLGGAGWLRLGVR